MIDEREDPFMDFYPYLKLGLVFLYVSWFSLGPQYL